MWKKKWGHTSTAKVRIKVTWGVGRELIIHSAEVPMDMVASLLRSVKTSQPATCRQRRPGGRPGGRKGEGCKRKRQARRKLIRERGSDFVVRTDVDVADETADSGPCLVPGSLADVVPGSHDDVDCLEPVPAASGGDLVPANGAGGGDKQVEPQGGGVSTCSCS